MRTFFFKISYQNGPETHSFSGVLRTHLSPRSPTFYDDMMERLSESMSPPRNPKSCTLDALSLLDKEE